MPLASFRIRAQAGEPAAVEINGRQLPEGMIVHGLTLRADGPAPQLTLVVSGEGHIDGEGVVYVQSADGGDPRAEMRELLLAIDPEELDRKALEHAPTLDSKPGEGYIAALLEMI